MKYDGIIGVLTVLIIIALVASTVFIALPIFTLARDFLTAEAGVEPQNGSAGTVEVPLFSISSVGPLPLSLWAKGIIKDADSNTVYETGGRPLVLPVGQRGTLGISIPADAALGISSGNLTLFYEVGASTPPFFSIGFSGLAPSINGGK